MTPRYDRPPRQQPPELARVALQPGHCLQFGYGAEHEFVVERDGERQVAVGGAVEHAFLDELGTDRPEAVDGNTESFRNVATALRAEAQASQGLYAASAHVPRISNCLNRCQK